MSSSSLSVSQVPPHEEMLGIEREIRQCQRQLSTASLDQSNQTVWQIGKRLRAVENKLKDTGRWFLDYSFNKENPIATVLDDLASLKADLQCLTTRISIVMRQQGKAGLQSVAHNSPLMRLQAMGERLHPHYRKECFDLLKAASKVPPKIDSTTTGNEWLVTKVKAKEATITHWNRMDSEVPAGLSYRFIRERCEETGNWDLASHFPKRTLNSRDVQKIPERNLPKGENFAAIMDLLSGRQAMYELRLYTNYYKLLSLYVFSENMAREFAEQQRDLCSEPLEKNVQQAAGEALKKYKGTFSPDQYRAFEKLPEYQMLVDVMMSPSKTIKTGRIERSRENWLALAKVRMADGLKQEITPDFLIELNSALRKANPATTEADKIEQEQEGKLGFREHLLEYLFPSENTYYLPQRGIKREIDYYCKWVNAEIEACDRGERNPIVVATSALQRLVSIHPFANANGRTSRFVADMILRRYGILPSAWEKEEIPVFPVGKKGATPSEAVTQMLEGLERSYKIVAPGAGPIKV